MSIVFKDHLWKISLWYLEDIIVFDRTQQELLERLNIISTGLKGNLSKCTLFRTDVEFLGHLVTANGVDPPHTNSIRDWQTPHCLRDICAFFGLLLPICVQLCYHRRPIS